MTARPARRIGAAAAAGVIALVASAALSGSAPPGSGSSLQVVTKPNLVLILSDDQRLDSMWAMPHVRNLLGRHGVTFRNAFVTTPVCCPSRASILTGQYSRHTGVYGNLPPNGGAESFRDRSTLATWLHDEGYTTGLVGKYLNAYDRIRHHIPPGWDRWAAISSVPTVAYQNFTLNEDGRFRTYGRGEAVYSTTVLERHATNFVRTARPPFFLHFTPIAPHPPATPHPRDVGRFDDLPPIQRTPSFDEADVSDKPWKDLHPRMTNEEIAKAVAVRQNMLESLQALDRAVAAIVRALEARGELDNTVIVYTSDNGFLLGEHRLWQKIWPYDETTRVPLVIRAPWITTGLTDDHLVLNIDLAPTLAELAGAPVPDADGRSLVSLLRGRPPPWRTAFVEEFLGRDQRFINEGPPAFSALRTTRYLYVEYAVGWRELYDVVEDPYQLQNLAGRPETGDLQAELSRLLGQLLER
jgi:N-acetylglucosamine-6-sulfatase